MMVRHNSPPSTRGSHTPNPVHSDSDVVVLALVTAQALEAQGEIGEAAQWLRRATEQTRRDGNAQRVVLLARAASVLMSLSRTTTSHRAEGARAAMPVSVRSGRVFAQPLETRQPHAGAMEALLALIAGAG